MANKTKEQLKQENQDLRDEIEFLRELVKKLARPDPIKSISPYSSGIIITGHDAQGDVQDGVQITCSGDSHNAGITISSP